MIGGYGATFHQRAKFIYKTVTECTGHFIRKRNWHDVLTAIDPELRQSIERQIMEDYKTKVYSKIVRHKRMRIWKLSKRRDFECMMSLGKVRV